MNILITKNNRNLTESLFLGIYFLSICLTGIFFDFFSCIYTIGLAGVLVIYLREKKELKFYLNPTSMFVLCMVSFYFVNIFCAIDSGMAFVGFLKFLPLPFFLLIIMQDQVYVKNMHEMLPYIVAILSVVSWAGMHIDFFSGIFSVAGRLAGTFQYPNSFAMVLLVSELLLMKKKELKKTDAITLLVLLLGILLTGSRIVLILTVLANIICMIILKNKKVFITMGLSFLFIGVCFAIYIVAFDNTYLLDRLLSINLGESTFVGRILYAQDALPTIFKHPLGLGYMGYYYLQQMIQTGVYSVMYIHNEFLQIALDVGWIPFLLFVVAIVTTILSHKGELYRKVILIIICIHCLFDFDLQFISVFCLLLTFLDYQGGREICINRIKKFNVVALITSCICLYMGIALFLSNIGMYELSHGMYPLNTQNEQSRILTCTDIDKQKVIADAIMQRNPYVVLAYSVNARNAYQRGNFDELIQYKRIILDLAPFQYDEYEEYCYMLMNGIELYEQNGDYSSAQACKKELLRTVNQLYDLENRLSVMARKIDDQPVLEFPADIQNYVQKIRVVAE